MAVDLHCHLNGSLSLPFLEKVAKRNKREKEYELLVSLQKKYFSDTQSILDALWEVGKEGGKGMGDLFSLDHVKRVWEQFGLVHKIILTLQDIEVFLLFLLCSSLFFLLLFFFFAPLFFFTSLFIYIFFVSLTPFISPSFLFLSILQQNTSNSSGRSH